MNKKINNKEFFFHSSAPWQQIILEKYLRKIKVNKNWRCLELGCGIGNNLNTILKFTQNITALDVSLRALEYCRNRYKNYGMTFFQGNAQKLPFSKEIFDLVICTEVLEHSSFPEKIIKESKRVLRHRGYLVLSSQNYLNLAGLIKIFMTVFFKKQNWDAWGTSDESIENFITAFKIKRIIKKLELKIIKEDGADYLNAWLIWLPFVYRNYKLLNKMPLFCLGKIPFIKKIGMDYFLLLQKK